MNVRFWEKKKVVFGFLSFTLVLNDGYFIFLSS